MPVARIVILLTKKAQFGMVEAFGKDRFEAILRSPQADELFGNILSSLDSHLAGGVAHDDLSVVLAQCTVAN